MEQDITTIGAGLLALAFLLFVIKWIYDNSTRYLKSTPPAIQTATLTQVQSSISEEFTPVMLKETDLIPPLDYEKVVRHIDVNEKESLDQHLNVLTKQLAEKEGQLQLSKTKIRETQHEILSLHAIDQDVRAKYQDIMDALKKDLVQNERDCKKLQEQIEWVSLRRAELKEEVPRTAAEVYYKFLKGIQGNSSKIKIRQGQKLYGEAAADLASNLVELQRGRVIEKPLDDLSSMEFPTGLRNRREPQIPGVSTASMGYHDSMHAPHRLDSLDVDA